MNPAVTGTWDVRIETFIKAPPQVWTFTGPDDDLHVEVDMGRDVPESHPGDMTITDAKLAGSTFTWTLHVTKPAEITTKGTATVSADGRSFAADAAQTCATEPRSSSFIAPPSPPRRGAAATRG